MNALHVWLSSLIIVFIYPDAHAQLFSNLYPLKYTYTHNEEYRDPGYFHKIYIKRSYYYNEQHHPIKVLEYEGQQSGNSIDWQLTDSTIYSYDSANTYIAWKNAIGLSENKFDTQGRLLYKRYTSISGIDYQSYQYDNDGHKIAQTEYTGPDIKSLISTERHLYYYDAKGNDTCHIRQTGTLFQNGYKRTKQYNALGKDTLERLFVCQSGSWKLLSASRISFNALGQKVLVNTWLTDTTGHKDSIIYIRHTINYNQKGDSVLNTTTLLDTITHSHNVKSIVSYTYYPDRHIAEINTYDGDYSSIKFDDSTGYATDISDAGHYQIFTYLYGRIVVNNSKVLTGPGGSSNSSITYYYYYDEMPGKAPAAQLADASISPNPFTSVLNIQLTDNYIGPVYIAILDMHGRLVYQNTINQNMGPGLYPIDLSQLPKGTYIIHVQELEGDKLSETLIGLKQ